MANVADNWEPPVLAELIAETYVFAHAQQGGATASITPELTAQAEVLVPWATTSEMPQANVAVSTFADVHAANAGETAFTDWWVGHPGDGNDEIITKSLYEIVPPSGAPEVTDGTLSGMIDIIISFDGNPAITAYAQRDPPTNYFNINLGTTSITGNRNANNNGWVITGAGDVLFFDEQVNLIIFTTEPVEVGQNIGLEVSGRFSGLQRAFGYADDTGWWGISLHGSFDAEAN